MTQTAITMTSKGTFTLPAKIRKELGLKGAGDRLMLSYHAISKKVELTKAPDLAAMRTEIASLIPASVDRSASIEDIRKAKHEKYAHDHIT